MTVNEAISKLDDFSLETRLGALEFLAGAESFPEAGPLYNLHCHSFFSYNANGWSPSRIAYECRKAGLFATGLCDFDVLDGVEEFIKAGEILGIRTAAHVETRAFISELSAVDINSPGEHGVAYTMGCGFFRDPLPDSPEAAGTARERANAQSRNLGLVQRINAALPEVAIDIERDLMPITPRRNPTERHIISAFRVRANQVFPDAAARAAYWSKVAKRTPDELLALESNIPAFEELLRSALAKRGGVGYKDPDISAFPPIESLVGWIKAAGAIPTCAWLDGTSDGEADAERLVELMVSKEFAAMNIIPDRNIRGKTEEQTRLKLKKLGELVAACVKRDLPVIIGTEMNKHGLPFVDDITAEVYAPYRKIFTDGAYVLTGHTKLARYANAPYLGARAVAEFASLPERNAFYAAVGRAAPLTVAQAAELRAMGTERAFSWLSDSRA